ncbi:unnamed protein product [Oncorhynchus mykiss]|uniref:Alkylated DNA repair protein AlkB homologue 8 N-terminal domain-containing protein n=1 Tax=Oncorhynchus mykiss TaxID=8022 RepID=A0A060WJ24_ONCMY|nr:unnamed protein product [Oncorhynchus mykiss]
MCQSNSLFSLEFKVLYLGKNTLLSSTLHIFKHSGVLCNVMGMIVIVKDWGVFQDKAMNVMELSTCKILEENIGQMLHNTRININGAVVERVKSFKFIGVHITNKLSWSNHAKTVVKRVQQNLFPLRRLKRLGMGPQILKKFYSCTTRHILTGCITAWYVNCSTSDRKALQRVVRMAQYITGAKFPVTKPI